MVLSLTDFLRLFHLSDGGELILWLNSTAMAHTYIVKYLCIIVYTLITDLECE